MKVKRDISTREAARLHRQFSRQQQVYERYASRLFYSELKRQISEFVDIARTYPTGLEQQAVNEISEIGIAQAYEKVAIRVGVGYANISAAEITAEETGQKYNAKLDQMQTKATGPDDRSMVEAYLRLYGAKKVVGITETTRKWITEQITKGYQSGLTFDQIAKGLTTSNMSAMRALRIARTETVAMMNLGRFIAANNSNFQKEKTWISSHDSRVRPGVNSPNSPFDHHQQDIGKRDLEEPFFVSGEELMFPGDSSLGASAGNTIQCRCTMGINTKRDENGRMMVKPNRPTENEEIEEETEAVPVSVVRPGIGTRFIQELISMASTINMLRLRFLDMFK